MPRKFSEAEVVEVAEMTPTVRRFILKPQHDDPISFTPGQFITLDLPVGEKRLDRWKSYSLANDINGGRVMELCIVHLEGGKGTTYLFNEIEAGDKLSYKGPEGAFVLPTDLSKELVLICTGTGVAPFKSMIQHIIDNKIPFHRIHLIFGCRTETDVLYREYFENIAQEKDNFSYSICLSREDKARQKDVHHGYVHQVYEEDYSVVKPNRLFMLCGWSNMIDEAVERLTGLGYDKSQIIYELYG